MTSHTEGFSARIQGASIIDLVQMECIARFHGVTRVTSTGRIGYLYFHDGEIVHALTPDATGERAALEILQYRRGSFEPCQLEWPAERSIHTATSHLLLLAAQLQDESSSEEGSAVSSRKVPLGAAPPAPVFEAEAYEVTPTDASNDDEWTELKTAVLAPYPKPPFEWIQLTEAGEVLDGDGSSPLAGIAGYAARLASLVGDALGLGPLQSFECDLGPSRCWVVCNPDRTILGVKGDAQSNLDDLRRKLERTR